MWNLQTLNVVNYFSYFFKTHYTSNKTPLQAGGDLWTTTVWLLYQKPCCWRQKISSSPLIKYFHSWSIYIFCCSNLWRHYILQIHLGKVVFHFAFDLYHLYFKRWPSFTRLGFVNFARFYFHNFINFAHTTLGLHLFPIAISPVVN